VNDYDLLAGFSDFCLSLYIGRPQSLELSGSYLAWETKVAKLRSGKGHMIIDSVVWAQYINVTDTQTATSPQQLPRQRSKRRAAKTHELKYLS